MVGQTRLSIAREGRIDASCATKPHSWFLSFKPFRWPSPQPSPAQREREPNQFPLPEGEGQGEGLIPPIHKKTGHTGRFFIRGQITPRGYRCRWLMPPWRGACALPRPMHPDPMPSARQRLEWGRRMGRRQSIGRLRGSQAPCWHPMGRTRQCPHYC